MNKQRRIKLQKANFLLGRALQIVSYVKDEEQDSLENMPENLQASEQSAIMESAIDSLEEAIDNIEEAATNVRNAL